MAKLCTHCGNPLPKDDARFCNHCGSVIERLPLKEQIAFPSRPRNLPNRPAARIASAPSRELHSRVWTTPDVSNIQQRQTSEPGIARSTGEDMQPLSGEDGQVDVEDLPTSLISIAPTPEKLAGPGNDLELLETRPYPQYQSGSGGASLAPADPLRRTIAQRPVTPIVPASLPGMPLEQPASSATYRPAEVVPRRSSRKKRWPLIGSLLVLLLLAGVVAWLIAYQPFDVPTITKTTASFQNASLGVGFQYPQGWSSQLDSRHNAAYFYDANHTDQFNLNVVAKTALSVDQYIKNTTGQLGMTGEKTMPPLTFAGQSWQQVRGSVLQSGATYTETLLATTRAGRIYALLFMSPAPTYTSADRLFFAPVRSSFQFL